MYWKFSFLYIYLDEYYRMQQCNRKMNFFLPLTLLYSRAFWILWRYKWSSIQINCEIKWRLKLIINFYNICTPVVSTDICTPHTCQVSGFGWDPTVLRGQLPQSFATPANLPFWTNQSQYFLFCIIYLLFE